MATKTRLDTLIAGGRVLLPDGALVEADVGIAGGKIAALAAPGTIEAAEKLSAKGLVVMPGAIDSHIHLGHANDISRPRVAADAVTESAAAAAGGVTMFCSFLIDKDPFETGVLDEVIRVTQEGARTDFAFHLIISTEAQLQAMPVYARDYGIPTFKVFMYSRGGEGARLGLPDIDDGFLFRLAEMVNKAGGVLCPHCENIEVAWILRDRLKPTDPNGKGGLKIWNDSRPPFIEAEAVHRVATIARAAKAPVHMVHCSSGAGLEAAVAQRKLGTCMTVETCIQYLTHTIDWKGGDVGKVNPPIRDSADVEALWAGIKAGHVDTVATDHVHRNVKGKAGGIWAASPGFPGMETLLPVMLSEGHAKRGLSLGRVAELVSQNPARLMGAASKGAIAVGRDADLAIVDLKETWVADQAKMHSNAGFSIYEGWKFTGRVVHTLVRGRAAFRDKALVDGTIGHGRFVRRSLTPAG